MGDKIGYTCNVLNTNEVVLNLSEKCNNFCLNCPNDDDFRQDIINENEVYSFIDSKVNKYTDRVTFIGGEPTILPYLFKVIYYIKKINNKIIIQINSNGRMFSYERFSKQFLKYDKDKLEIHIALYGSSSEIHDKITQIKGSFKQTVKGIQTLLKLGISVDVRNIISKINYKDLVKYSNFLSINFNQYQTKIRKIILVGMDIVGNAWKHKEELAISHLESAPYIEKCIDILNQNNFFIEVHLLPKGIFKKKYQKYSLKSGCIGGDFVDSFLCKGCSELNNCAHLLRSYTKIFGNKEHQPIYKIK